jgi:hypothetical protein
MLADPIKPRKTGKIRISVKHLVSYTTRGGGLCSSSCRDTSFSCCMVFRQTCSSLGQVKAVRSEFVLNFGFDLNAGDCIVRLSLSNRDYVLPKNEGRSLRTAEIAFVRLRSPDLAFRHDDRPCRKRGDDAPSQDWTAVWWDPRGRAMKVC